MNDLKWIKIAVDIFDDEKIMLLDVLPNNDSILVIWFKLLCLAGKQNNSGVFFLRDGIPYTDDMLAVVMRRPVDTVRMALAEFERLGMIEIISGTVTIPNWDKHQSADKLENRKQYMKDYMRKLRKKQEDMVACKHGAVNKRVNSEVNSGVNSEVNSKHGGANKAELTVSTLLAPVNPLEEEVEVDKEKEEEVEVDVVVNGDNDDERPDFNTVQVYATSNLSYMTPTHMEELNDFTNDLPDEVIRFAIDQACGKGIRTWAFVRKVLSAWIDAGVKSLGDAKAESERHSSSKSKPATQDYQQHDRIDYANFEFYDPLKEM